MAQPWVEGVDPRVEYAADKLVDNELRLHNVERRKVRPTRSLNVVIDGRGSPLTTGIKGDVRIDYDFEILSWVMLADAAGDVTVDIWRAPYADFPPDVSDSITGSTQPALGGGFKASDDALTGWTTELDAGDILRYNVDAADGLVGRVTLTLKLRAL